MSYQFPDLLVQREHDAGPVEPGIEIHAVYLPDLPFVLFQQASFGAYLVLYRFKRGDARSSVRDPALYHRSR